MKSHRNNLTFVGILWVTSVVSNKVFKAILICYNQNGIYQWFPTTAPGTTSALQAALKCSPKNLKSTILFLPCKKPFLRLQFAPIFGLLLSYILVVILMIFDDIVLNLAI